MPAAAVRRCNNWAGHSRGRRVTLSGRRMSLDASRDSASLVARRAKALLLAHSETLATRGAPLSLVVQSDSAG